MAKGLFTHQSLLLSIHMHGHSLLPFICSLLSLFNDIQSILDIQSHCVVMGASSLISTLFIHSHVTRYLGFLGGEFSKDCGQKACGQRRCNEVEWVITLILVLYIYSMQ